MTAPQILVVDDEADIRGLIEEILLEEGYRVTTAADGGEARASMTAGSPDLVLLDIWMPDVDGITLLGEWSRDGRLPCPVVVMSGHGTVETAVEATRLGATDFVEKPLSLQKLLRTVARALDKPAGAADRGRVFPAVTGPLGKSAVIRELRERAREVATHPAPVLLIGEPGSGREALARFIHDASDGDARPFVRLVAGALPAANAAVELFGTDAQPGFLERAAGGSLFVDELDTLCDEAQRLLLGALERGGFARLGEARAEPLACRLLASVSPAAAANPAAAGLQPALLERLAVLSLRVPALREYPEDISELLRQSVDRLVETEGLPFRRFGLAAQNRLRNYPWPGNLGELRQLVRRLLLSRGPEEISLAELEAALEPPPPPGGEPLVKQDLLAMPLREAREHFERAYLTQQLKLCDGKVGQLAKRVGMERTHLYRKLRSLGVDFRQVADD